MGDSFRNAVRVAQVDLRHPHRSEKHLPEAIRLSGAKGDMLPGEGLGKVDRPPLEGDLAILLDLPDDVAWMILGLGQDVREWARITGFP